VSCTTTWCWYTPNVDYFGADSFNYQICDTGIPILCSIAQVNINIKDLEDVNGWGQIPETKTPPLPIEEILHESTPESEKTPITKKKLTNLQLLLEEEELGEHLSALPSILPQTGSKQFYVYLLLSIILIFGYYNLPRKSKKIK
jgi:hypothetical protein